MLNSDKERLLIEKEKIDILSVTENETSKTVE